MFPSQPQESNSGKIESINIISYIFYDSTSSQTSAVSLWGGKVLDKPVSTTIARQWKPMMILHNKIMITPTPLHLLISLLYSIRSA